MAVFSFIIDILLKWAQEIIDLGFHNIYTFILIGINTAFAVVVMERVFRFDRRFSWLGGILVFVWLVEQVMVRKSIPSLLLTVSVVIMLFVILFVRGVISGVRKIMESSGRAG